MTTRPDPFVRFAGFVGDFGNPFLGEERQRDVWNEASVFGLQLTLWTTLLATTGAVWALGRPAVPWVVATLTLLGVVSLVTVAYACRLGVEVTAPQRMLRARMIPFLLLVVVLGVGLVRASDGGASSGFGVGAAVGALLGVGAIWLAGRRRSATGS